MIKTILCKIYQDAKLLVETQKEFRKKHNLILDAGITIVIEAQYKKQFLEVLEKEMFMFITSNEGHAILFPGVSVLFYRGEDDENIFGKNIAIALTHEFSPTIKRRIQSRFIGTPDDLVYYVCFQGGGESRWLK